jgi:hypothetical protein
VILLEKLLGALGLLLFCRDFFGRSFFRLGRSPCVFNIFFMYQGYFHLRERLFIDTVTGCSRGLRIVNVDGLWGILVLSWGTTFLGWGTLGVFLRVSFPGGLPASGSLGLSLLCFQCLLFLQSLLLLLFFNLGQMFSEKCPFRFLEDDIVVLVREFRHCLEGWVVEDEFLEDCVLIWLYFGLREPLAQAELQDLEMLTIKILPHGCVSR